MTERRRVAKAAQAGESRRGGSSRQRKDDRETEQEKWDVAHGAPILRAPRSTTYYGQWPAKTAAEFGRRLRAIDHNENLYRGYPQRAVEIAIA
jgi:hypothetical protein